MPRRAGRYVTSRSACHRRPVRLARVAQPDLSWSSCWRRSLSLRGRNHSAPAHSRAGASDRDVPLLLRSCGRRRSIQGVDCLDREGRSLSRSTNRRSTYRDPVSLPARGILIFAVIYQSAHRTERRISLRSTGHDATRVATARTSPEASTPSRVRWPAPRTPSSSGCTSHHRRHARCEKRHSVPSTIWSYRRVAEERHTRKARVCGRFARIEEN